MSMGDLPLSILELGFAIDIGIRPSFHGSHKNDFSLMPNNGKVNKESGMPFKCDIVLNILMEGGSILYKMSFRDHGAIGWV